VVKITGPLLSLHASGSIGETVTFSTTRGRAYAKTSSVPRNPKTAAQLASRAMFTFLTRAWKNISAADQATWSSNAERMNVPPYNAYLEFNLTRWRNFTPPSKILPPPGTGTYPTTPAQFATAVTRGVALKITSIAAGDLWAYAIFRGLAPGFTTGFDNLIAIPKPSTPAGHTEYLDSPLAPGTYYYNFRSILSDGKMSPEINEKNATVL